MVLEQGAGGFCRTSRGGGGGEQGAPFTSLSAECRDQIRGTPLLLSASHRKSVSLFGSLGVSHFQGKGNCFSGLSSDPQLVIGFTGFSA